MNANKAARHPGGRPPLPPELRRRMVALRLRPATLARLDALAASWGVSRVEAVERLVGAATA